MSSATTDPRLIPVGEFPKSVQAIEDRCAVFGRSNKIWLQKFREVASPESMNLLSLDVFDTLLLRNEKPEALRFLEIGKRCLRAIDATGLTAEDFLVSRLNAAVICYRTRPHIQSCREGHIDDILRVQCRYLGLPEDHFATFKAIEIDYECENLVANRVLVDLMEEYQALGKTVVLISDMYLDGKSIGEIARRVIGTSECFTLVCSSADEVISKRSGLLFISMAGRLGIDPATAVHIGDSLEGDVRQARKAGWQSVHFPISDGEMNKRRANLTALVADMAGRGVDVSHRAQI